MIKIIGTLKKVDTKSKVGEDGRTYHNVVLGLEITDGVERIQEIVESLKQLCSVNIDNVQPTLDMPRKPYAEDNKEEDEDQG